MFSISIHSKKEFLLLSIFLYFILTSCQSPKKEKESVKLLDEVSTSHLINDPRSPNPSSELAVLMRDMWEYADTMRVMILDSTTAELPAHYIANFKNVHQAIPTDSSTKSASFDAMANIMLQKLEKVYQNASLQEEKSVQVEGFNLFVNSCLQCHQRQCPGPISKIQQLLVKK